MGGSVGSGWVGSFLSFLLLSLKPPPQFCRFFYWFALRRQSFFCHHSHLFFCKHQAWQRKPVQICGGGKKSLIFFIAMKYFFSQNLARIFVWWFFLGHQPWSDLGTMYALTRGTKTWVAGKHCYLEIFWFVPKIFALITEKPDKLSGFSPEIFCARKVATRKVLGFCTSACQVLDWKDLTR